MMNIGAFIIKLTSPKVEKVLADFWMPEHAGLDAALLVRADVHDVLISAVGDKLAKSSLVELTDCFNCSHCDFLFLKLISFNT